MKLIDKDKLVAEIERRMDFHHKRGNQNDSCVEDVLYGIINYINTIEVKEVDLEKALSDLDKDLKEFIATEEFERESTTVGHYWVIAKHAFLLGIKAQKGE